jgi:hypothetical protein
MKRQKQFPVLFTESEWLAFEALQASYTAAGVPVSKATLIRYGLKRLPHQSPITAFP